MSDITLSHRLTGFGNNPSRKQAKAGALDSSAVQCCRTLQTLGPYRAPVLSSGSQGSLSGPKREVKQMTPPNPSPEQGSHPSDPLRSPRGGSVHLLKLNQAPLLTRLSRECCRIAAFFVPGMYTTTSNIITQVRSFSL